MVSDDAAEFAGEVAVAALEQKVVKAVVRFGDEYSDTLRLGGVEQFPVQLQVRCDGFEVSFDFGDAILFDVEYGA